MIREVNVIMLYTNFTIKLPEQLKTQVSSTNILIAIIRWRDRINDLIHLFFCSFLADVIHQTYAYQY